MKVLLKDLSILAMRKESFREEGYEVFACLRGRKKPYPASTTT